MIKDVLYDFMHATLLVSMSLIRICTFTEKLLISCGLIKLSCNSNPSVAGNSSVEGNGSMISKSSLKHTIRNGVLPKPDGVFNEVNIGALINNLMISKFELQHAEKNGVLSQLSAVFNEFNPGVEINNLTIYKC
jgi:hypothetical protein